MRLLKFYVGFKVTRDHKKKTIKLLQLSYIKKLFDQYKMLKAKITKILIREILLLFYENPVFSNKKINI